MLQVAGAGEVCPLERGAGEVHPFEVYAGEVGAEEVKLEFSHHDPVAQRTTSQQVVITAGGIKLYPIKVRYAWPSELDLMARLAGMRLRDRWPVPISGAALILATHPVVTSRNRKA